jgi:hypothetical protein
MSVKNIRRGNAVAKDLRSPKYRQRIVSSKKIYNRHINKKSYMRELYVG